MSNTNKWIEEILVDVIDDLEMEVDAASQLDALSTCLEAFKAYNGFDANIENYNDREAIRDLLFDAIAE